jgi:phage gpG-like protein
MIGIDVDDKEAMRMLAALSAAAADLSPATRMASKAVFEKTQNTFDTESDPWGNPWAPLSQVTLDRRAKADRQSIAKLFDTGKMFGEGITHDSDALSFSVSIKGNEIERFPVVHQFGNPRNKFFNGPLAPIPARPMLPIRKNGRIDLPSDWIAAIFAPFDDHFEKALDA